MFANVRTLAAALKSGTYQKRRGYLRSYDCFCAEGVACEISGLGYWNKEDGYTWKYVIPMNDGKGPITNDVQMPVKVDNWLWGFDNELTEDDLDAKLRRKNAVFVEIARLYAEQTGDHETLREQIYHLSNLNDATNLSLPEIGDLLDRALDAVESRQSPALLP